MMNKLEKEKIFSDISHTIYYAKGISVEGKMYYTLPK